MGERDEPKGTADPTASTGRCTAPHVEIGVRLTEARRRRGWTKAALAAASGLDVRTIGRIEGGAPASSESRRLLGLALGTASLPASGWPDGDPPSADRVVGLRLRELRRARDRLPLALLSSVLGNVSEATLSRVERGLCRPRGGWADLLTDDYAKALGFNDSRGLCEAVGVES